MPAWITIAGMVAVIVVYNMNDSVGTTVVMLGLIAVLLTEVTFRLEKIQEAVENE